MYPYLNPYNDQFRQQQKLVKDIEQAVNGEFSAVQCYAALAKLAPNEAVSKQILEIREDESKHLQQFMQIYSRLTGQKAQPKVSESCPNQYIEGLEAALEDEQHTVDFYLTISDETNNQYIKEIFRRAAADEQQHAVWFLYYFTKQMTRLRY